MPARSTIARRCASSLCTIQLSLSSLCRWTVASFLQVTQDSRDVTWSLTRAAMPVLLAAGAKQPAVVARRSASLDELDFEDWAEAEGVASVRGGAVASGAAGSHLPNERHLDLLSEAASSGAAGASSGHSSASQPASRNGAAASVSSRAAGVDSRRSSTPNRIRAEGGNPAALGRGSAASAEDAAAAAASQGPGSAAPAEGRPDVWLYSLVGADFPGEPGCSRHSECSKSCLAGWRGVLVSHVVCCVSGTNPCHVFLLQVPCCCLQARQPCCRTG